MRRALLLRPFPLLAIFVFQIMITGGDLMSQENRRQTGHLFFLPLIYYEGESEPEEAGSGFFVNGPKGKIFGVTSAHVFDPAKKIEKVEWLNPRDRKAVATFSATLGEAGSAGRELPAYDFRRDFMIFPLGESSEPTCLALTLSGAGQEIQQAWFPYRDERAKLGWRKIAVEICGVDSGAIGVFLKERVDLKGRAGSPLISVNGNRVIGILSKQDQLPNGKTAVLFAPVGDLRFQLASEPELVPLKERRTRKGSADSSSGE